MLMPYQTHGLRHDTEALFAKLLAEETPGWQNMPCVVIWGESLTLVRAISVLLGFPDDAHVICGWPGAKRQDVFEFTVGQFRAFVQARSSQGGQEPMTACDEKCVDDPKPDAETGATEENVKEDAAAEGAAEGTCEAKPEGECAGTCEKADEPAAQPTEDAAE